MQLWALLSLSIAIGFIQGFLHCAGMCGPFVLAYSMARSSNRASGYSFKVFLKEFSQSHVLHNLGRITSFTILGAVFGFIGSFVNTMGDFTGIEAVSALLGGWLMIGWAIDEFRTGHGGSVIEKISLLNWRPIQRILRQGVHTASPVRSYFSGLILGMHPCGLLFALLVSAASTGSMIAGGLCLLAFGIGTIPSLFTVAMVGWYGRRRFQGRWVSRMTASFISLSGAVFILRGLVLNHWIPSVNPWLF